MYNERRNMLDDLKAQVTAAIANLTFDIIQVLAKCGLCVRFMQGYRW
jgi:hypothetical protein